MNKENIVVTWPVDLDDLCPWITFYSTGNKDDHHGLGGDLDFWVYLRPPNSERVTYASYWDNEVILNAYEREPEVEFNNGKVASVLDIPGSTIVIGNVDTRFLYRDSNPASAQPDSLLLPVGPIDSW